MTSPATRPPSDLEIEWQFDALDLRPVERRVVSGLDALVCAPDGSTDSGGPTVVTRARPAKRLVDTYFDTADWRVHRAGYVLRIRRRAGVGASGSGVEVTLKDRTPATDGLRRRLEVTEPCPDGGLDAIGAEGPVGRRLHALAGRRPLVALFDVRTRRRPYVLEVAGESIGELALDETVIDVPHSTRPLRLQRVEIEVSPEWVDRVGPIVERLRAECGLQPATMSKFEAGLLGAGLTVPPGPDVGPTTLPATPTIAELAFVVLRRNLVQMLVHEPGTRLGEDPEELHDMRVATRRMRAALSLFSDVLPVRAQSIRTEIGWVADALGRVRDLDVQLERVEQFVAEATLEHSGALKDLAELLDRRRHEARAALLAALDSTRYERLVTSFTTLLRHGPLRRPGPGTAPALLAAPDLLRARHKAVSKAAKRARRSGRLDDFHTLRIRGKRLRYAVEFVSELYRVPAKKYVRVVVRLQDALGSMQDARVAAEQLHSVAIGSDEGLSRETVFVLGGLAERFRHESTGIATAVPKHLDALSGKRWHRLTGAMDDRRVETAQLSVWPGYGGPRPTAAAKPAASPVAEPAAPADPAAGGSPEPPLRPVQTPSALPPEPTSALD